MVAEDHVWMVDEVAVDRERLLAIVSGDGFGQRRPRGAGGGFIGVAFLQEQNVDDDIGSGARVHAALRQTDRADEVGHGGDVGARPRVALVHGPAAGDEGGEAARLQPFDRARDEIIMQREAELADRVVGANRAVAERRVAEDEIVTVRQAGLGEILMANEGVRIEEPRDAGGGGVHLDAGEGDLAGEGFGHEREEKAGSAAGFEHAPAGEAHAQ